MSLCTSGGSHCEISNLSTNIHPTLSTVHLSPSWFMDITIYCIIYQTQRIDELNIVDTLIYVEKGESLRMCH